MKPANIHPQNRVIFFDNLRYLCVLFVILEHASHAYDGLSWWPVADGSVSRIAEGLSAFSDAFAMPFLFYIAGYFALPVIQKKGIGAFLKGKLKRLGIPWLVCLLTVCPVLPLIYHYTRNGFRLIESYWDLWRTLLRNAAELNVGIVSSMNDLMASNQFYQRYMWFLSLLLLFFFVFSMLYYFKKSWFDTADQAIVPKSQTPLSTLKLLLGVGFLTTLFSFLTVGAIMMLGPDSSNPEPLLTLGNLIQFRPSRFVFYVIYFGMGILTYRNKWIEKGKFPGHLKTWGVSFVVFLVAFLFARNLMINGPEHLQEISGAFFFFMLNFLCISTVGLFTALALRYWNRPSTFDRNLASNSYYMYLSHYLFVILFQLVLLTVPGIPGWLKFGIVSALSVLCAYLTSQFLIKPRPRISIVAASGLFIAMALIINP